MPRAKRSVIAPDGVSVTLHCYSRCVRRAFLCGIDKSTGVDYAYRKQWIQERLELLASLFAIDILGFAVMDNHFHLVCRTRPDIAEKWDRNEIARRWYRLYPKRRTKSGEPEKPTKAELEEILFLNSAGKPELRVEELRRRLQNVSWLMKGICEYVSKRANQEDDVRGAFWEGRFKSQKLLDEQAILACSVYVDLNPVRSARASTPEDSQYTSVYERIRDRKAEAGASSKAKNRRRITSRRPSFLVPVALPDQFPKLPTGDEDRSMVCKRSNRASNKGFAKLSRDSYLMLVDWTGRQVQSGKRGAIPSELAPILDRLEMTTELWLDSVTNFRHWFGWAVGSERSMTAERERSSRQRLRGIGIAAGTFG